MRMESSMGESTIWEASLAGGEGGDGGGEGGGEGNGEDGGEDCGDGVAVS